MAELRFLRAACDDYERLDHSRQLWVDAALLRLRDRGAEIGERLAKTRIADLHGLKKLKNNKLGLRLIFRVCADNVEIIEILVIGKREDFAVYKEVEKRLKQMMDRLKTSGIWTNRIQPPGKT
ncbi:MAG TPA: addiction module toxin RelE [Clostridia bacterium]